jgi:L-seryl-tRNA(Ser) seleniumtransferase
MSQRDGSDKSQLLRALPSVDALLNSSAGAELLPSAGRARLVEMIRDVLAELRKQLTAGSAGFLEGGSEAAKETLLDQASRMLRSSWEKSRSESLKRVINATGVIVHTNLGRAPLSESARRAIFEEASRYCNLEFDLSTGTRGTRGAKAEKLICDVTGAEAALIVNNCAAATMLVLKALAEGGEAVVSRGELVEIGGDFRVPEVMAQSGVRMVEVGTTNRTKTSDYESAVTSETRIFLRVHPSNYRVIGFTETPGLSDLADAAHRKGVLLYEDAGSGALVDLSEHGFKDEPLIRKSISDGADVVTFSGDKLLGGMQAGIVVGRSEVIERVRRHPLYRALRVDKLVYAGIQATLESFVMGRHFEDVPVLRMLSASKEKLRARTESFAEKIRSRAGEDLMVEVQEATFVVGGGSAAEVHPESVVVAIGHRTLSADGFEQSLRTGTPPVIGRIAEDLVLLDLRTVFDDEEDELADAVIRAAYAHQPMKEAVNPAFS